jgi:hypothetical protein
MDRIAALRGPKDIGSAKRRPWLVRSWYRLNVVTVMLVRPFTSDCISCKADRDSHHGDKALDHGSKA